MVEKVEEVEEVVAERVASLGVAAWALVDFQAYVGARRVS